MKQMLSADLKSRLEDASDSPLCLHDPSRGYAGVSLEGVAEPADAGALSRVLKVLDEQRSPVAILGSESRSWLGNPLKPTRIGISTARLSGIDEFDEADGVIRVGAGTALDKLAERTARSGWWLPIDSPGRGGTVGGALATALCGPRRRGFGPVRDSVLGLDTVLAQGAHVRCGARVVKNVTGYDMAKLYVGSLGTLGVIERAWLRLRAAPESALIFQASIEGAVHAEGLAVARRATTRAIAVVDESLIPFGAPHLGRPPRLGKRHRLIVEFAGDAPAVDQDGNWLADELGAEPAPADAIESLRDLQILEFPIGVRVRFHTRPSQAEQARMLLERGGARCLICPEPSVLTAWFEAGLDEGEDPWWLDQVFAVVDEVRAASSAEAIIEALPDWARGRRDAFGGSPVLGLMRDLKERFDPNGILNPGRFVGRL